MRTVIQRVSEAQVEGGNKIIGKIGCGLLIFVGIEDEDGTEDIDWLVSKIINLRIFNDEKGVMNLAVTDIHGELLVVSQFTLHASTRKGNRPSYIRAAKAEIAIPLYEEFLRQLEAGIEKSVASGTFGAMMTVSLINDGPVTIIMDTKNKE
jgi:D-tyrosyl-tRNA(Tyr) deacylase